jgi:hypothetical protein
MCYSKTVIEKNSFELLISQTNFAALVRAFSVMYDHHDAKSDFSWAIKFLVFFDIVKDFILSRDSYWVKDDNFIFSKKIP